MYKPKTLDEAHTRMSDMGNLRELSRLVPRDAVHIKDGYVDGYLDGMVWALGLNSIGYCTLPAQDYVKRVDKQLEALKALAIGCEVKRLLEGSNS